LGQRRKLSTTVAGLVPEKKFRAAISPAVKPCSRSSGTPGVDVSWTFIHIWRVSWTARSSSAGRAETTLGSCHQIGAWPPSSAP
jgi:hypothetical protein